MRGPAWQSHSTIGSITLARQSILPLACKILLNSQAILATKSVVEHPQVSKMLEGSKLAPTAQDTVLRGVADKMTIYQIPY